jgi:hypothetical protein
MSRTRTAIIILIVVLWVTIASVFFWSYGRIPEVSPPLLLASRISDKEREDWRVDVLSRFQEPSLESLAGEVDEAYRFVLTPTFDHPISISATRSGQHAALVTKLLDGLGGFDLGKIAVEERRDLSIEEWLQITELFDKASFWSLPTIDQSEWPIVDGASWHLEGFQSPNYHLTIREWPKNGYLDICRCFLDLEGRENDYQVYSE